MHDNFEIQIKQKITLLPVIKHGGDLWENVRQELDFDDKLSSLAKELPVYCHSNTLWYNIQNKTGKRVKRKRLYYTSVIAASVLLLISIVRYTSHNGEYGIGEPVRIQNNTAHTLATDSNTEELNAMIQQFCNYSNINYNSPDFIRIKSELSMLETGIRKLNEVISDYGESDELIKCLIKMENQKSELINELFNS